MDIPSEYLRPFPNPEEVFGGDIKRHARHFLPVCSLDVRFFLPEHEEFWLHFVQPADIYEGCIGDETEAYHDEFNLPDSFCFDVDADGKYRFNGDWRLFESENDAGSLPALSAATRAKMEQYNLTVEQVLSYYRPKNQEDLAQAIRVNHQYYQLMKAFYRKHGRLPLFDSFPYELTKQAMAVAQALPILEGSDAAKQNQQIPPNDKGDFLEDAGGLSADFQRYMQDGGVNEVWELFQEEFGNLFDAPKRADGRVFDYIGWLYGYRFQAYACDELYLFYDKTSRRAVIRLVYS